MDYWLGAGDRSAPGPGGPNPGRLLTNPQCQVLQCFVQPLSRPHRGVKPLIFFYFWPRGVEMGLWVRGDYSRGLMLNHWSGH